MSLREIARQAGVSVATVSRVVNDVDRNKVSDETRDRVLGIARAMHYRPNPQAVALVTGRPPNVLGLYLPYNSHVFDSFYFTEIIRGAADAANSHGMSLALHVPSRDAPRADPSDLLGGPRAVAGLLVIGARIGDPIIERGRAAGTPMVLVNNPAPHAEIGSVDCDNVAGAREAVRHLLSLGRRRIAFIAGPDDSANAMDRRKGYEDALREAGIAVDPALVLPGDFLEAGGRAAMEALLALSEPPTAVFAANDMMALGAMGALRDAGRRVPDDVALVGFDDIPLARYVAPALTTIHQPIHEVGRRAAEMVLERARAAPESAPPPAREVLPTRLIVRESSG